MLHTVTRMFYAVLAVTPWAAGLILALLALRRAGRRVLSPRFFQLAFLLLALRLALPMDLSLAKAPVRVELPAPRAAASVLPLPDEAAPSELPGPAAPTLPAPQHHSTRPDLHTLAAGAALVWAAGALCFLTVRLAGYGRFCWQLFRSRRLAPPGVYDLAWEAFGHPVRVFTVDGLPSPMLVGLFAPALYLPAEGIRPQDLPFILEHEACHARRWDLPGQFLLLAAQSVHWFDPLVHWMARAARLEMELGCDEAVLAGRSLEERRAYGMAVLSVLRKAQAGPAPTLSTGFTAGSDLKRRFTQMFDATQKRQGLPLLALLLALILGASALVGCGEQRPETVPAAQSQPAAPIPEGQDAPGEALPEEAAPGWGWPLEEGTAFEVSRVMSSVHKGMDVAAEQGVPLLSLLDGTVTTAQMHYSYGLHVVVQAEDGRRTLYAHCDQLLVQEGDTVTAGQPVATVGSTGNCTGSAVHIELYQALVVLV